MASGTLVARGYVEIVGDDAKLKADLARTLSHMRGAFSRQLGANMFAGPRNALRALPAVAQGAVGGVRGAFARMAEISGGIIAANLGMRLAQIPGDLIGGMLSVNAEAERLKGQFGQILGSTEQGDALFERLRAFAAQTPFTLPGAAQGARNLLMMGFSADEVIQKLTMFGDVAAMAVQGPNVGMERLTRAMRQIKSKGRFLAEEGEQLAEAGIDIWPALAKVLGTDVPSAINRARQGGLIPAEQAMEAFFLLANDPKFKGGMARANKEFLGQWEQLKDQASQALGLIGQSLFMEVKAGISQLNKWLQSPAGQEWITRMKGYLDTLIQFVKSVTSIITSEAFLWGAGFLAAGFAVTKMVGAVLALKSGLALLVAHPAIAAIVAIGAAAAFAKTRLDSLHASSMQTTGEMAARQNQMFGLEELRKRSPAAAKILEMQDPAARMTAAQTELREAKLLRDRAFKDLREAQEPGFLNFMGQITGMSDLPAMEQAAKAADLRMQNALDLVQNLKMPKEFRAAQQMFGKEMLLAGALGPLMGSLGLAGGVAAMLPGATDVADKVSKDSKVDMVEGGASLYRKIQTAIGEDKHLTEQRKTNSKIDMTNEKLEQIKQAMSAFGTGIAVFG